MESGYFQRVSLFITESKTESLKGKYQAAFFLLYSSSALSN